MGWHPAAGIQLGGQWGGDREVKHLQNSSRQMMDSALDTGNDRLSKLKESVIC